jgi:hypothetical protein
MTPGSGRKTGPSSARLSLAWRKNLSKTRAIMQSFLPRSAYRGSGPHLLFRLFLAGNLGVLVACGADDPTPNDAAAGAPPPDASVRDLPGDGLETTPDDLSAPRGLVERPELRDVIGSRDPLPRPPSPDAAPPDAGEDASDANGSI